MIDADEGFSELISAIEYFCENERKAAKGRPFDQGAAKELRSTFTRELPDLSQQIPDAPNTVYSRYVIIFAVRGLSSVVFSIIWQDYYGGAVPVSELSSKISYGEKSTRNFVKQFPERVATQLWEEQLAMLPAVLKMTPGTIEQRAKRRLEEHYDLSKTHATVLFEFSRAEKAVGRKAISDRLFISINTLKAHTKRILKQTGSTTMNEATNKARTILQDSFGDEWEAYYSQRGPES